MQSIYQVMARAVMIHLGSWDLAGHSWRSGHSVVVPAHSLLMEDAEDLVTDLIHLVNVRPLVGKKGIMKRLISKVYYRGTGGGSRFNQGSSFIGSTFVGSSFGSSSCNQPPFEFGRCGNNFQRWSYVWQTGSCRPYIYSGCGGSQNANRLLKVLFRISLTVFF